MELEGKTALITGAGQGVAFAPARHGARIGEFVAFLRAARAVDGGQASMP